MKNAKRFCIEIENNKFIECGLHFIIQDTGVGFIIYLTDDLGEFFIKPLRDIDMNKYYLYFDIEYQAKEFIKKLCKFLNENYCADMSDFLRLKEEVLNEICH